LSPADAIFFLAGKLPSTSHGPVLFAEVVSFFSPRWIWFLQVESFHSFCKSRAPARRVVPRKEAIISCCATRLESRSGWLGQQQTSVGMECLSRCGGTLCGVSCVYPSVCTHCVCFFTPRFLLPARGRSLPGTDVYFAVGSEGHRVCFVFGRPSPLREEIMPRGDGSYMLCRRVSARQRCCEFYTVGSSVRLSLPFLSFLAKRDLTSGRYALPCLRGVPSASEREENTTWPLVEDAVDDF